MNASKYFLYFESTKDVSDIIDEIGNPAKEALIKQQFNSVTIGEFVEDCETFNCFLMYRH